MPDAWLAFAEAVKAQSQHLEAVTNLEAPALNSADAELLTEIIRDAGELSKCAGHLATTYRERDNARAQKLRPEIIAAIAAVGGEHNAALHETLEHLLRAIGRLNALTADPAVAEPHELQGR